MTAADLHRMMKMAGRITGCCVALLLTLTSVSAVRRALNSINDLKSVAFGQSVPEDTLLLLHWFATTVDIDINSDISLTFDPNSGDYGSHHYGNYEELLDPLPRGYQYYTLGNINREGSLQLPDYVTDHRLEYEDGNRARIIIRVREQNVRRQTSQIIDQVYITQHYETYEARRTEYDPQHTYPVTTSLLRAIRKFPLESNNINLLMSLRDHFGSSADDSQLWQIRNMWGDLACVGLLLFIVIQEKYSSHKCNNRPQQASRSNTQCDVVLNIPESRQIGASVVPERYNSNLHFTSQAATQRERQHDSDNTWVILLICVLVILFLVVVVGGFLYPLYSLKQ